MDHDLSIVEDGVKLVMPENLPEQVSKLAKNGLHITVINSIKHFLFS